MVQSIFEGKLELPDQSMDCVLVPGLQPTICGQRRRALRIKHGFLGLPLWQEVWAGWVPSEEVVSGLAQY